MDWTESYYEALEFFYWEPQHLGRKKYENAALNSIDKVTDHLRKMEVTLNQNLHQFFLLSPPRLVSRILEAALGATYEGAFMVHGRNVDAEFRLQNSVQPDLLLTTEGNTISIEMKLGAKCGISQVLKYALLCLAVELRGGSRMNHALVLMGRGAFRRQWYEQLSSCADLHAKLVSIDLTDFMGHQPAHFREHSERFGEIVRNLRLGYLDYEHFAAVLRNSVPCDEDKTEGADVYRKLLSGMIHEMSRRTLTTASKLDGLAIADTGVTPVLADELP